MPLTTVMAIFKRLIVQSAVWCIRAYRYFICPLLQNSCRFTPSCSSYAIASLNQHGLIRGGWLIAKRILRCHPFSSGGLDPVPTARQCCDKKKQKAST